MFDQSINDNEWFDRVYIRYVCMQKTTIIAKATVENYFFPHILSMMRIQRDFEHVLMHF